MITNKLKTAVIAIPLIILIINWSSVSFLILVLAVVIMGLHEFYELIEDKGYYPQKYLGIACGICLTLTIFLFERRVDVRITGVVLTVFLFLFFLVSLIKEDAEGIIISVSVSLLGVFYVAWTISHSILLRDMRPYGRSFIYLLLFTVWSINLLMNWLERKPERKRKNKAGINLYVRLLAASIAGMVFVLMWQKVFELEYFKLWAVNLGFLPLYRSLIVGLILGISSQIGYLVNSRISGNAGIGDSRGLFPGYGGVLENISTFQFSIPLTYYFIRFFVV